MDVRPAFDAYVGTDKAVIDQRDAKLFRAIETDGSLNAAADTLGRSYSRAQRRIVELEEAFGPLVRRRRGGADGGGSELTPAAAELLAAFERARMGFEGVAEVAETIIRGTIVDKDGELATVDTPAGRMRALVPQGDGEVQLTLRADAVTIGDPDDSPTPTSTSARNRFPGTVVDLDRGERVVRVSVDIGTSDPVQVLVTDESMETLSLEQGRQVEVRFKATATRGISR